MTPGHTSLPRGPEGTIYYEDDNLRIEIDPTKIKFIKELKRSEVVLLGIGISKRQ